MGIHLNSFYNLYGTMGKESFPDFTVFFRSKPPFFSVVNLKGTTPVYRIGILISTAALYLHIGPKGNLAGNRSWL